MLGRWSAVVRFRVNHPLPGALGAGLLIANRRFKIVNRFSAANSFRRQRAKRRHSVQIICGESAGWNKILMPLTPCSASAWRLVYTCKSRLSLSVLAAAPWQHPPDSGDARTQFNLSLPRAVAPEPLVDFFLFFFLRLAFRKALRIGRWWVFTQKRSSARSSELGKQRTAE